MAPREDHELITEMIVVSTLLDHFEAVRSEHINKRSEFAWKRRRFHEHQPPGRIMERPSELTL
jgi:hypothetical protein